MSDHLKAMLQDVINDRTADAELKLHDYIVAKTREVTGVAAPVQPDDTQDEE